MTAGIPIVREPRRLVFIANPRAGDRGAATLRSQLAAAVDGLGVDHAWHETTAAGHARELAGTLDVGEDAAVCAVGGDGTIHEVANGLLARPKSARPALGVVPAGTGNSLALDLRLDDPLEAVHRIVAGHGRELDAARVELDDEVIHAINIIGWGAFARINRRAESLRRLGRSRYTVAAVTELLRPRIRGAGARLDGAALDGFLLGAACVTRFTGTGMCIAPHAVLGDGYLDLVLVRRASRVHLATVLRRVFDGSHIDSSRVDYRRVERLTLELEEGSEIVIDGELRRAGRVDVSIESRALSVLGAPPPPPA